MSRRRELPVTLDCRELVERWKKQALAAWKAGEPEKAYAMSRCAEELAKTFGFHYEQPWE